MTALRAARTHIPTDRAVIGALVAWFAVDATHSWWHYRCSDATAADLVAGIAQTITIAAIASLPLWLDRARGLRAPLLGLAGAYSVLRGIVGTFFTDESPWIHVALGLSGFALLAATLLPGITGRPSRRRRPRRSVDAHRG